MNDQSQYKIYILVFTLPFLFCTIAEGNLLNNWGIKLGYAITTQDVNVEYVDDTDLYHPRSGINLGIFAEFNVYNSLFLLSDFSYAQKGSEYKLLGTRRIAEPPGFEVIEYKHDSRLDYLSLLIAFGYRFRFDFINPYLILGPRIDYLISNNHILSEPEPLSNRIQDFEKINYGLSIGGGIEIPRFLPFNILIEFIYSPDLSKSYSDNIREVTNYSYELNIKIGF